MKKKFLSIMLTVTIIVSLMSAMCITASAEDAIELKLGDYVQMGSYNGSPILWRCVSFDKVTGYDNDGNPIVDSTNTKTEYESGYLPLMLCDDALCDKCFDSAGWNTIGSHDRAGKHGNKHDGYYRGWLGSNYWRDSNIRCWLNSEADEGKVIYTCGNSPAWYASPYTTEGEAGFLTNFSVFERNVIKKVNQKSILDKLEYGDNNTISSLYDHFEISISIIKTSYRSVDSERTIDKMFLLDVMQLANVYYNSDELGSFWELDKKYWLRTPSSYNDGYLNQSS